MFFFRYRLSLFLSLAIVVISFLPQSEIALPPMSLSDKYAHFLMYGVYSLSLWIEARSQGLRLYLITSLWPICLGGLLEMGQSSLTTSRQGDWIDFLANSLGVLLTFPIGWCLHRRYVQ